MKLKTIEEREEHGKHLELQRSLARRLQGNFTVLGGAGFVGSNVARRLVKLREGGARIGNVVVVDNYEPGLGGNPYNLDGLNVEFHKQDIGKIGIEEVVSGADFIINTVGSVIHTKLGNTQAARRDNKINYQDHFEFIQRLAKDCEGLKKPRVVYTSTRDVYGNLPNEKLPATEETLTEPTDIQGVHKLAAEKLHSVAWREYGIPTTCLRLTNTFGPFQNSLSPANGVIPWMIRQAYLGNPIEVWKFNGKSDLRDVNYIDDVVNAILLSCVSENAIGKTFNLGGCIVDKSGEERLLGNVLTIEEIAGTIASFPRVKSEVRTVEKAQAQYMGDFYGDCSKAYRKLGWLPHFSLNVGVRKTLNWINSLKPEIRASYLGLTQ